METTNANDKNEPKTDGLLLLSKRSSMKHAKDGEEQRPNIPSIASGEAMSDKIYQIMQSYLPKDIPNIQRQIVNHVEYTLARTRFDFKSVHCYKAAAYSVRDRLIEYFNDTNRCLKYSHNKKVYYLSMQFLLGRLFQNALVNIDLEDEYRQALRDLGYNYEIIKEKQVDPALGYRGLGRLAACFLDSLATLNYPAWGYGLRYDYGIFSQLIKDGYQIQVPDFWLNEGNPWQIERVDVQYKIKFYGKTSKQVDANKKQRVKWENCEVVNARAFDTPIPGYGTFNTIGLRLWKSYPVDEFDFNFFNKGQYESALEAKQRAQSITSVLSSNNQTKQGKQLKLKQEYLLISATIQDIIRRHKSNARLTHKKFDWKKFPKEASIQINETQPSLAIVQLLRILLDEEELDREDAWQIVYDTFSYTNHSVLQECMEVWNIQLMSRVLPRHMQLIYEINHYWLEKISKRLGEDSVAKRKALSLIDHTKQGRMVRMGYLCIVGTHKVNGVSEIHSQLLKKTIFKDFYEIFPNKFVNVTNGVSTRRWIICANPPLAQLYTQNLMSDAWILNMDILKQLQCKADDTHFQQKWANVKMINKKKLIEWLRRRLNIDVNQNSMFDVHIKRVHQYKRQLLHILYTIYRYLKIRGMTQEERRKVVPRTVIMGGKASPNNPVAKRIIKFIHEVKYIINDDRETKNLLQLVFIPDYNVSHAEIIIPATELSEHISLAGTQASGTSNMKFALNGSLLIGTMDGATIEIYKEVKPENIFIFGAKIEEVESLRQKMIVTAPQKYFPQSLLNIFQIIRQGKFGEREILLSLISTITNNNDWFLIGHDFESYIKCQEQVDDCYRDQKKWTKMSILNAIRSGKFSSDRSIQQYAKKIWDIQPCKVVQSMVPQMLQVRKSAETEDHKKSTRELSTQVMRKRQSVNSDSEKD